MKKILIILVVATISCLYSTAMSSSDDDAVKKLEEKYGFLQEKQSKIERCLREQGDELEINKKEINELKTENSRCKLVIDSLTTKCEQLENMQSNDRKTMNDKISVTNSNVSENQTILQNRTLFGGLVAIVIVASVIIIFYRLLRRIKSGNSSIDDVRKAQEALQSAQLKMQEESVKLDDKLLELIDRQMSNSPKMVNDDKPDHSLALKVADEIVRIELNMSRMDSSIKGYKQLAKAVERIKDNFKANGYEIVDMLGKPYNEGMKVTANFVADEDLEEGKQIITGITKPQINYNGQMIQAAQITVSQNI